MSEAAVKFDKSYLESLMNKIGDDTKKVTKGRNDLPHMFLPKGAIFNCRLIADTKGELYYRTSTWSGECTASREKDNDDGTKSTETYTYYGLALKKDDDDAIWPIFEEIKALDKANGWKRGPRDQFQFYVFITQVDKGQSEYLAPGAFQLIADRSMLLDAFKSGFSMLMGEGEAGQAMFSDTIDVDKPGIVWQVDTTNGIKVVPNTLKKVAIPEEFKEKFADLTMGYLPSEGPRNDENYDRLTEFYKGILAGMVSDMATDAGAIQTGLAKATPPAPPAPATTTAPADTSAPPAPPANAAANLASALQGL